MNYRSATGGGSGRRPSSLARRVGLELVVLTVALNMMLGAAVTWVWMKGLRSKLDRHMIQVARQASVALDSGNGDSRASARGSSPLAQLPGDPTLVVVRSEDGRVLQSTPGAAPGLPFEAPVARDGVFTTIPAGSAGGLLPGGQVRMLTMPARGRSVVQVAVSQGKLDELERTLGFVFLLLIPPLTAGASLAAWLVAGRRLKRLKQISELARGIQPGKLDRRLDETGENDECGQLAQEVNRMLERLEAGFQAEDRFISEVSHELKTPVSVMLIEAQVLMRSSPDSTVYAKFVSSVEDEMRRLSKLIESFLTIARAGHGDTQIRRVAVDMNDAAMEASEHCWQLARLRSVRLSVTLVSDDHCPDAPVVEGDPELLRTMIENLLRNAVSVSPRDEAVDLRVSCEESRVILRVRDRGPGVPEELAPRIFERFVTADHAGQGRKGVGLGLTIAKGIAAMHGGDVGFCNLPAADGGGAEFFAALPMHADARTAG
jgi:signal transduction histidine kinase